MIIIGCGGLARSGKDTFCSIASNLFEKKEFCCKKYSFANVLKKEVAQFLKKVCGCDVWTDDPETKSDIRDFLVWYGTTWWRKRDPERWIRNVDSQLRKDSKHIDIAFVSDVRYSNEADWIHTKGGVLIHISKYRMVPRTPTSSFDDGPMPDEPLVKKYDPPPNIQEELNDPLVKAKADYCIEWEFKNKKLNSATNDKYLIKIVNQTLFPITSIIKK